MSIFPTREEVIERQAAEIDVLKRQLEAARKLEFQKGFEAGSALTTYNKPRVESLEAEVEILKATLNDARNVIQNIVFGDRKPFDMDGWAQVPWIAIAKGAEFLGNKQENGEYKPLTEADAPFQKVAPKELSEAIDSALGINDGKPAANTEDTAECPFCYVVGTQTERFSTQNHMEAAVRILTQLGFSQEASREYGVDERRDRVVDILGRYFPANWIDKDGNIFYTDTLAHTLPLYKHNESDDLIRTTTLTMGSDEITARALGLGINPQPQNVINESAKCLNQELVTALLQFVPHHAFKEGGIWFKGNPHSEASQLDGRVSDALNVLVRVGVIDDIVSDKPSINADSIINP